MPRKTSQEGMIAILCPCCKTVFFQYDLSIRSPERYMGSPHPRRVMAQYDTRIEPDGTFKCPVCGATLNIKKLKLLIYKYRDFVSQVGYIVTGSDGRRVLSLLSETDNILLKALSPELRSMLTTIAEAYEEGSIALNSTGTAGKAEAALVDRQAS